MPEKNIPTSNVRIEAAAMQPLYIEGIAPDPAAAVEALLEEHANFFQATEELWDDVSVKAAVVVEELEVPRLPGIAVDEASGAVRPAVYTVGDGGSRRMRRDALVINTRQYLADINHQSFIRAGALEESGMLDKLYNHFPHSGELIKHSAKSYATLLNREFREHLSPDIKVFNVEEVTAASHELEDAYVAALIGQQFGVKKLEELLANETYAEPLLARLEELMSEGKNGPREYPGLLEVVANYVIANPERDTNQVQQAMERITAASYTESDFMADLLLGKTEALASKKGREIIPHIAGAQLMAKLVSIEFADEDLSPEQLIARVSRHFDAMPKDWQDMYAPVLRARIARDYDSFVQLCKPYAKRGRRPTQAPRSLQIGQPPRQNQKRKSNSKRPSTEAPAIGLSDISSEVERQPLGFAVLKSIQGSDHFYNAEIVEAATITEHPIVSKFVEEYPGTAQAIEAYLKHLSEDPYNPLNTTKLTTRRITIQGSNGKSIHLRRYRPIQNVSEGPSDKLLERVRIKYAVADIDGKKHIVLEGISLRGNTTY